MRLNGCWLSLGRHPPRPNFPALPMDSMPPPPPSGLPPGSSSGPSRNKASDATVLISTMLDMLLLGLVTQQYYAYWISGFRDRFYLKLFVNVQFALVTFQAVMVGCLAFEVFVDYPAVLPPAASIWSGPVNSLCQLFIIVLANIFLAFRIHGLTKSLIQSLIPMVFSILAFVFGIVNIVATTWTMRPQSFIFPTSVVWYASQVIAECLITFLLVRALLKARSGVRKSDLIVRDLIRNVVQIGLLANIWAIASLVSWFWLSHVLVYRVFNITSGAVYTHAIFETLISRTQLRNRMATSVTIEFGHPTQSEASRRYSGAVIVPNFPSAPLGNSGSESESSPGTTLMNKNLNEIHELGELPPEKREGPYGF